MNDQEEMLQGLYQVFAQMNDGDPLAESPAATGLRLIKIFVKLKTEDRLRILEFAEKLSDQSR
ncbi:hypothetical protein [Nitrobacter sp.]|uniref:hypothetical protein n=1 Tax=Nitrobacter sp. TaxID=29420 RepID=UPI003F65227F